VDDKQRRQEEVGQGKVGCVMA